MHHFMIDGFRGFRSRFDDVRLVQEVLEELPPRLGLQPAMPAFLLPYYNGVVPEDCGISAFVFLRGGHFTLHTFSFREVYFADLFSVDPFDTNELRERLETALPCATTTVGLISRPPATLQHPELEVDVDFGPHLFLDIEAYRGPQSMDDIFQLFDGLPQEVGMTPIMRPYVLRGSTLDGTAIVSAMTMVAESHVSLHVLPERGHAFFDLFSCRFFDAGSVVPRIRANLPGQVSTEVLMARGRKYRLIRTERVEEVARGRSWLTALDVPRAKV